MYDAASTPRHDTILAVQQHIYARCIHASLLTCADDVTSVDTRHFSPQKLKSNLERSREYKQLNRDQDEHSDTDVVYVVQIFKFLGGW